MNKLLIPLASLESREAKVDLTVTAAEIQPEGARDIPAASVHIQGVLSPFEDGYIFRGELSGAFEHACDRCLDTVESPYSIDVIWVFAEGGLPRAEHERPDGDTGDEEDGAVLDPNAAALSAYSGNEINLAPQAWEEVALAAPAKFLCASDCAGLCPGCGVNLNRESCACATKPELKGFNNQGLRQLGDLFPELRSKNGSED